MEDLPETLISNILKRIDATSDRNSISLMSKTLYTIEGEQRQFLKVGCGLHPVADALLTLCIRFPNLHKLEIDYSGWMSNLGNQLDNQGLALISSHCLSLDQLILSCCSFINDAGLAFLASLKNLESIKLNFAPAVSSTGILSLVVGCKKLSSLHLIRCMNIGNTEWLEYLGKSGILEDLSIKNCRGIGDDDLMKLGDGWKKLKRLELDVHEDYRSTKVHDLISSWDHQQVCCEMLKELSLTNCKMSSYMGLSWLFKRSPALEKLRLDKCINLSNRDMFKLCAHATNLRRISVSLPTQFMGVSPNSPLYLTDVGMIALVRRCSMLEDVELSFSDAEFLSTACLSNQWIVFLIERCKVRTLAFNSAYFFNDIGMEALCCAHFLQKLELVKCQEVGDDGMNLVVRFPCLIILSLCKCLGVTDIGLRPLVGTEKLKSLTVEDCPRISEKGVQGTAISVSYKQDLSWLC